MTEIPVGRVVLPDRELDQMRRLRSQWHHKEATLNYLLGLAEKERDALAAEVARLTAIIVTAGLSLAPSTTEHERADAAR